MVSDLFTLGGTLRISRPTRFILPLSVMTAWTDVERIWTTSGPFAHNVLPDAIEVDGDSAVTGLGSGNWRIIVGVVLDSSVWQGDLSGHLRGVKIA